MVFPMRHRTGRRSNDSGRLNSGCAKPCGLGKSLGPRWRAADAQPREKPVSEFSSRTLSSVAFPPAAPRRGSRPAVASPSRLATAHPQLYRASASPSPAPFASRARSRRALRRQAWRAGWTLATAPRYSPWLEPLATAPRYSTARPSARRAWSSMRRACRRRSRLDGKTWAR